jgi:hypothetical protein
MTAIVAITDVKKKENSELNRTSPSSHHFLRHSPFFSNFPTLLSRSPTSPSSPLVHTRYYMIDSGTYSLLHDRFWYSNCMPDSGRRDAMRQYLHCSLLCDYWYMITDILNVNFYVYLYIVYWYLYYFVNDYKILIVTFTYFISINKIVNTTKLIFASPQHNS